jgi:trehalose 6-phosphate phosphatase
VSADPLAPFRADPSRSAVLLDVDGVLAPIVARPELSAVPEATLVLLSGLLERYRLVACVSGRTLADVRRLVPLPGLLAAGNHGLELDIGDGPELVLEAESWLGRMEAAAELLDHAAGELGGFVERKGATLTVHWREAPDPVRAATELSQRAIAVAHDTGLVTRPARMAIELRPPLPFDKGSAVRALLRARPCERSLYAGDDVTDIDAFAVVDVAVAVVSAEAPRGLVEAATFSVTDAGELLSRL